MRQDMERQLGEFQLLKRINDDLGSRVCALDMLAELDKLLPRNMALTNLSFEAVQLQVPLKGLAPGRYTCQLNVIDEVGRKFAFPRQALAVQ